MQTKKEEVFLCADCDKEKPISEKYKEDNDNGEQICRDCYSDNYFHCSNCGGITHNDSGYDSNDGGICENCYGDYFSCFNCGYNYHNDTSCNYDDELYCVRCYDDISEEGDCDNLEREYYDGNKYTESGKRFFSTEIECYYPSEEKMLKVHKEMNKDFGITHDGSLNSDGIEFQTPKLSGQIG